MDVPLLSRLAQKRILILDGGLASQLEETRALDHPLWSARVLLEEPGAVRAVHSAYLEAGADCITTAGYQISAEGLSAAGLSPHLTTQLMITSVRVALDAIRAHGDSRGARESTRPLVALSHGPYGAVLADGSEYRGHYGAPPGTIELCHRRRIEAALHAWRSLRHSSDEPCLMAFETIPSLDEAVLIARLLETESDVHGWISFSCRDEQHTCEGQDVADCARALESFERVLAVGVNCTHPRHIHGLVTRLAGSTSKPVLAYPNSGESYDASLRQWAGAAGPAGDSVGFPDETLSRWAGAGARLLGGCCRITPRDTASMVTWRDRAHGDGLSGEETVGKTT